VFDLGNGQWNIRQQLWDQELLFVAMTRRGQAGDCRRSQDAGFNFYMVKPNTVQLRFAKSQPPAKMGMV
jgi:hypothetical protein